MLTVGGDRTDLRAGQPVEAAGQLSQVAGPLNPGEFDYRAFLRTRGILLRLFVDSPSGVWIDDAGAEWKLRRWLGDLQANCRTRLTAHLDERTAPLAVALILGQRDEIDPEVNDAFARTGTTHLLAISGLQLQAVAVFLIYLFRLLRIPRRPAYVAVAARHDRLCDAGRSCCLGRSLGRHDAGVLPGGDRQRPTRPANTLALAGLVTLAWNPFFLFDVGCQLSFLAIAALIWLVPLGFQRRRETGVAGSALLLRRPAGADRGTEKEIRALLEEAPAPAAIADDSTGS